MDENISLSLIKVFNMSFNMKTVRAMYQRLINKMFANLIGKTMEVYIN